MLSKFQTLISHLDSELQFWSGQHLPVWTHVVTHVLGFPVLISSLPRCLKPVAHHRHSHLPIGRASKTTAPGHTAYVFNFSSTIHMVTLNLCRLMALILLLQMSALTPSYPADRMPHTHSLDPYIQYLIVIIQVAQVFPRENHMLRPEWLL